jgi:hypothetical protein
VQAEDYFASSGFPQVRNWARRYSGVALFFVRGVQHFIGNAQALDRTVIHNVRLNDFVDVFRTNAAVPDLIRINYNRRAEFALIEASGLIGANEFHAALRKLRFEQALQFALSGGIAASARMALFALIHADENVFCQLRHRFAATLTIPGGEWKHKFAQTGENHKNALEVGLSQRFHSFRAELDAK